jgi:uncharacterized protein (TIGR02996 family)
MTDADTEEMFLEAIRANPDDDDARRVYADWLEERGDPRAEYLRVEIHLARGPRRLAELAATVDRAWVLRVGRRFRIVLETSSNKISTIKTVREITGLGLRDALQLVDSTPNSVIARGLDVEQARELAERLGADATVRIEADIPARSVRLPPAIRGPHYSVCLVDLDNANRDAAIERACEVRPDVARQAMALLVDVAIREGEAVVVAERIDGAEALRIADLFHGIARARIDRWG